MNLKKYFFACLLVTVLFVKQASASCPPAWVSSNTSCYNLVTTPTLWEAARDDCAADDAHLLELQNMGELSFIMAAFNNTVVQVWTSVNDRAVEGVYVHDSDNGPGCLVSPWKAGQPDNAFVPVPVPGDQDCVLLSVAEGVWFDEACIAGNPYMCEKDLPSNETIVCEALTTEATTAIQTTEITTLEHTTEITTLEQTTEPTTLQQTTEPTSLQQTTLEETTEVTTVPSTSPDLHTTVASSLPATTHLPITSAPSTPAPSTLAPTTRLPTNNTNNATEPSVTATSVTVNDSTTNSNEVSTVTESPVVSVSDLNIGHTTSHTVTTETEYVGDIKTGSVTSSSVTTTEQLVQGLKIDEWTTWTACTLTCGNGVRVRFIICSHADGNATCPYLLTSSANSSCSWWYGIESQQCGLECPVDGYWLDWTSWSTCSSTCGLGSVTRSRRCTVPLYGGKQCGGDITERDACNLEDCPEPERVKAVELNDGDFTQSDSRASAISIGMVAIVFIGVELLVFLVLDAITLKMHCQQACGNVCRKKNKKQNRTKAWQK